MILFNWKANGTTTFVDEVNNLDIQNKNITIIPPLHLASSIDATKFNIGVQNVSQFENGAYTGEISAEMLQELGVKYCLVGHSERRQHFGETNEILARKIQNLTNAGIIPVLCVGEKLGEDIVEVLKVQMSIFTNNCIVAYEPVWAIGTGKVPTNEEISAVTTLLRTEYYASKVLYGGSVSSSNVESLSTLGLDGVLVGGASLKIQEITEISKFFTK